MAPATAAPSPHRFIPSRQRNTSQSASKPSSALRHAPTATSLSHNATPTPRTQASNLPSSQQFSQTPRFSFAPPRPLHAPSNATAPSTLAATQRPTLISAESIEDASQSQEEIENEDESDEYKHVDGGLIVQSVEDGEQDQEELLFDTLYAGPKRRKRERTRSPPDQAVHTTRAPPDLQVLDASTEDNSANSEVHDDQPPSTTSARHHRFVFGLPSSVPADLHPDSSIPPTSSTILSSRPAFLKPSPPPSETSSPLPEAFSPHRRGQKFYAGGMVDTLRGWVVDVAQSLTSNSAHPRRPHSQDILRLKVTDVGQESGAGSGMTLVKGNSDGKDINSVLVGKKKDGPEPMINRGNTLEIKPPSWEIEVMGRLWTIGVDWSTKAD